MVLNMSRKNNDFDPISALFRDLSDSEEDVPEPLRMPSSEEQDEDSEETTTVIMSVRDHGLQDEDSDEDIVEPLALKQSPPVFRQPIDPDATEQVPVTKHFPPKPEHTRVSPAKKTDLARSLIEAALQRQVTPSSVELPAPIPIETPQSVVPIQKKSPAHTKEASQAKESSKVKSPSLKSSKSSKEESRWERFKRPKSALEMALAIAAEEAEANVTLAEPHSDAQKDERPVDAPDVSQTAETSLAQAEQELVDSEFVRANVLLTEHIASLLQPIFPNLEKFSVVRAIYADDRPLFESLWKSHRNKFILEGRLEYAIATLSVIHALKYAPQNDLVAAHMETEASDYLVWIRPSNGDVLAAFQDARRYFA